jgi:Na+/glutamate symporter
MNKLILILLIIGSSISCFAGPKETKRQLHAAEAALKLCMASNNVAIDTLIIYGDKVAVKMVKAAEKRKKAAQKAKTKQLSNEEKTAKHEAKQETKQNKASERNKTKRNFVFQFFNSIKAIARSLTIAQILGSGEGWAAIGGAVGSLGLFFEKFKPLTSVFNAVKPKK